MVPSLTGAGIEGLSTAPFSTALPVDDVVDLRESFRGRGRGRGRGEFSIWLLLHMKSALSAIVLVGVFSMAS